MLEKRAYWTAWRPVSWEWAVCIAGVPVRGPGGAWVVARTSWASPPSPQPPGEEPPAAAHTSHSGCSPGTPAVHQLAQQLAHHFAEHDKNYSIQKKCLCYSESFSVPTLRALAPHLGSQDKFCFLQHSNRKRVIRKPMGDKRICGHMLSV